MGEMYRVLVCDDAPAVLESLERFLRNEGMDVIAVEDGDEVLKTMEKEKVDLLILDVSLPTIDGMEVCREIRKSSDVPIIFLSARGEEIDRIIGLELGGDDYVTKPFSPREVAIRAKKLLKLHKAMSMIENQEAELEESEILSFGSLKVDVDQMRVYVADEEIEVTKKEVDLLIYLIRNKYKVLSREQILKAVWGYDYYGDTRAVDAVVKRIRRKLPEDKVDFMIQAIYGVGYRLGDLE